ncbi:MAG TPA: hypothetical protein VJK71_08850 [Gemmatimonadales bacterium]|nr:hypothetical protein [Gemmatimonadales bacterium]
MRRAALATVLWSLVLCGSTRAQVPPNWRWTTGAGLGVFLGAGEIGRYPNATGGHEDLVARLDAGIGLGFQAGLESRFGGLELRGLGTSSAVQVENEYGVRFPHHGGRPFAWTGNLLLYPLAPLQRPGGALRPFLTAGLGGLLMSVDLDNVNDQTLYHSFHWSLGGGVRIATSPEDVPSWTPTFLELRVVRMRVWPNGPLEGFGIVAATIGLGMRH